MLVPQLEHAPLSSDQEKEKENVGTQLGKRRGEQILFHGL